MHVKELHEECEIIEKGPWSVGFTEDKRVYIQSEDFTHDVRLYVDGDFRDFYQKLKYADVIRNRLNGI